MSHSAFTILPSSHAVSHAQPPETPDLLRELTRTVRGEVRFDPGARALYATDASNYRHIPIGLVVPRDEADVIATVAALPPLLTPPSSPAAAAPRSPASAPTSPSSSTSPST